MQLTYEMIVAASRRKPTDKTRANAQSLLVTLNEYGERTGLLKPHRLAIFLANVMHENAEFHYDQEIWGPTPAQKRYEDRADLGHSAAVAGEAFLFRGRTGIQITGRANYRKFTAWVRKTFGKATPDFEQQPDLLLTDPWEGLGPIWYWDVGNPDSRSLNRYADNGDHEMVRRRINGGLNGYEDVLALYDRIALVMMGGSPTGVLAFQKHAKTLGLYTGELDGVSGPQTRAAMHKSLAAMSQSNVNAAPVTEDVAVAPPQIDKPITQTTGFWERLTQIGGLSGIGGVAMFLQDWRIIVALVAGLIVVAIVGLFLHKRIIDAVRSIKQEIGTNA